MLKFIILVWYYVTKYDRAEAFHKVRSKSEDLANCQTSTLDCKPNRFAPHFI